MIDAVKAIVILSLLAIVYIYLGYPLLITLLARIRPRPVRRAATEPPVTILIAAHNEARVIEASIRNKLELEYAANHREIIVVSDGSEDGTDSIVEDFADRGVRLIRQSPRQGKTMALNRGVREAKGEIIVFADANSIYEPHALRRLVESFADNRVGYVTGKMVYTDETGSLIGDGCSAYMKYENLLRRQETAVGSVVGVDGGIDAVRKSLYRPMAPDQLPDFVLPLNVTEQGYRVVYEPRAVLREPSLVDSSDEYRMRVRVSLRALWAIHDKRVILNPLRFGIYSWQLASHKLLRYGAFLFLAAASLGNVVVVLADDGPFWQLLLLLQGTGYLAALLSTILGRLGVRSRLLYPAYYFVLLNVAAAHAFARYVRGQKQILWEPRKG